ncbi:Uncharacterized protein TPAR_03534 [Tolypocladium paradoxum]|uniref:Aminoglycoside phosphotransferase domain-containing protein n=1 Tax=Tolypocladium paradoxum TaxID=94208 RepID=A0A2S4L1H5_9HYPO|nr:Uncharacterized protein TPAR_03534 [Tolypocladium paradoxum]
MDDDLDEDVFGPLVTIPEESLLLLALNISNRVLHAPSAGGKLVARIGGSFNIVHIVQLDDIKLVIRVPATGWGSGLTATTARALESQCATMRLVRSTTTIPVPEVYSLDTTIDNEIGAPYVCMSFVPGRAVSKAWFDDSNTMPREELRLAILTSLSQTMARFSHLTFDKIGSVMEDKDGLTFIDPSYDWHENHDGSLQVRASGPFDSVSAYLKDHFDVASNAEESVWDKGEAKVMDVAMHCLLNRDSRHGFVLCPPDFDSQNVIVDDEGNVTGLIDWDLAQTMPRCVGYARYPGWITRDWDPLMQGDWELTEKSHIAEAIWIAALNRSNRTEICRKLVQVAADKDVDGLDVLYDIGAGNYGEEDWTAAPGYME